MLSVEYRIVRWIENHTEILFLVIMSILAFFVRLSGIHFESEDYILSLSGWYDQIKENGALLGLGEQVGNYTITYQVIIALMTYLPFPSLYLYKGLSIVFDYVLAFAVAGFVYDITERSDKNLPMICYTVVLFLPTVILNSSVWAQCDSIYSSFVVLALWSLYKKRYTRSFIFLGIAFCFKLQAVFIVPFFLYFYLRENKFSIFQFLIVPVAMYIAAIPAFLCGRKWTAPLRVYFDQTVKYESMYLNFPSFWALVGNDYETLRNIAIMTTVVILGVMLFLLIRHHISLAPKENYLMLATWTVWTVVLFLPAMHERYGFLVDILLLVLMFVDVRFAVFSIGQEMISLLVYGRYLFGDVSINFPVLSFVYVGMYFAYTFFMAKELKKKGSSPLMQNE